MSITGHKTHVMLHRYSHSNDAQRLQATERLPAPSVGVRSRCGQPDFSRDNNLHTNVSKRGIMRRAELKTLGLHIDGARALGAHNAPISSIARSKMWHRVLSMRCPQKSPPVPHARAITVARTQQ